MDVISFGGPLPDSEPIITENGVEEIPVRVHYKLLSQDNPLEPYYEIGMAQLSWEGVEFISEERVELNNVKFNANLADDATYVQGVTFTELTKILLARAGSEEGRPAAKNSLPSHCQATPCFGPNNNPTVTRRLPIKFINLSSKANITDICVNQLNHANGSLCHIWRFKAALDLTIWPNENDNVDLVSGQVENGTDAEKQMFGEFTNPLQVNFLPHKSASHVEVYIVDALEVPAPGGSMATDGITYFPGTVMAACILSLEAIDVMVGNPRLLAHELCHVLNLDHPIPTSAASLSGSAESIAQPGNPLSDRNTAHNMQVLTDSGLKNEIVLTTAVADCFRPD